jgi:hypothetical protein
MPIVPSEITNGPEYPRWPDRRIGQSQRSRAPPFGLRINVDGPGTCSAEAVKSQMKRSSVTVILFGFRRPDPAVIVNGIGNLANPVSFLEGMAC